MIRTARLTTTHHQRRFTTHWRRLVHAMLDRTVQVSRLQFARSTNLLPLARFLPYSPHEYLFWTLTRQAATPANTTLGSHAAASPGSLPASPASHAARERR